MRSGPISSFLFCAAIAGATPSPAFTPVPSANPKQAGIVAPNVLPPELAEAPVAQGAFPLENPATNSAGAFIKYYGYLGDGPMVPAPGAVQGPGANVEATKTEPDKNTYLVVRGQHGADENYEYGHHFLFQGHETGSGYITRINLDADGPHRVTLLASGDVNGLPLPLFDGSTWDPYASRLLLSSETGASGGIWQATLDYPSTVEDISGALGRAGYEGIQVDATGSVWIVEDTGGVTGTTNTHAKQPNSFVYRFVPTDKSDLTHGKLQALQVTSLRTGQPIAFHAGQADADILSDDVLDLHTYGKVFTTHWITLHDTAVDGSTPYDANALAKTKLATPFKRPENAQFRPGTSFTEFYFDETGDTTTLTEAGSNYGGFGGFFRLTQSRSSANSGKLALVYRGDVDHTGFDNVAFWSRDKVVFVEDRGDGLHSQHNALDSAWMFDLRLDYSNSSVQPARLLALGRDASSTIDSAWSALGNGFQNEGDNEITGIHVSDGDPTPLGLLGAKMPQVFTEGWRVFYTQQHGDNVTWEILPVPSSHGDGHDSH